MFLEVLESDLDAIETVPMVEIYRSCIIRYMNIRAPDMTIGEMQAEIAQFFSELITQYYESGRAEAHAKMQRR